MYWCTHKLSVTIYMWEVILLIIKEKVFLKGNYIFTELFKHHYIVHVCIKSVHQKKLLLIGSWSLAGPFYALPEYYEICDH